MYSYLFICITIDFTNLGLLTKISTTRSSEMLWPRELGLGAVKWTATGNGGGQSQAAVSAEQPLSHHQGLGRPGEFQRKERVSLKVFIVAFSKGREWQ